ncbi:MAG TPA: hypothetical protein VKF42_10260 [Chitinivibrionales bacterium]|nr:hypothetical protein [Chitinivibrionales bacterium]
MALLECPECKGQASSSACRCPHCGFSLKGRSGSLSRYIPVVLACALACVLLVIFCSVAVNINSNNGMINFNSNKRGIFPRLRIRCGRCCR